MSVASRLGRYQIQRKLGGGGMGDVFLAKQAGLAGFERLVVLKTLKPELAEQSRFREMFLEEARLAAMARHINVVSVVDVGEHDGTYFIVMEYLEGYSLRQVLDLHASLHRQLDLGHCLNVAIDLARGLAHLHDLRDPDGRRLILVHRDVSPENLMLTKDGLSKLVDFGVAKRLTEPTHTEPGLLKGKARYMAPEQVSRGEIGPAADQFACGSVLFEMCTGEALFSGVTDAEVILAVGSGTIRDPAQVRPDLPEALLTVIRKTLAPEPAQRYPSCAVLADELAALRAAHGLVASRAALLAFMDTHQSQSPGTGSSPRERATVALSSQRRAGGAAQATPRPLISSAQATPRPLISTAQATPRRTPVPGDDTGPAARQPTDVTAAIQTSSLIGRDRELSRLRDAFARMARLVTLVGPGGVGKTTMAQHFATALQRASSSREVYVCDLTECSAPGDVAHRIATLLALPLTSDLGWDDALTHIGLALAGRGRLLLVLDNVEHVIDAAADVATRFLAAAPETHILVTSREPLSVPEEHCFSVEPLEREEAIELFFRRLRAARPDWSPTRADRGIAGRIVDQLDCLPLAIELAAARGTDLSLGQLHQRLKDGPGVLEARSQPGSRHASLLHTIEWSWELLSPWERAALAQCAVFRGAFTQSAAQAVVVLPANAPGTALSALQSLREKSLIYLDKQSIDKHPGEPGPRFRMYSSIRSVAGDKLGPERQAAEERHLSYFLGEAERLAAGVDRRDGAACLDRMAAVFGDLELALATAQRVDPALVARLVLAVNRLLSARGPARMQTTWLELGITAARKARARALLVDLLAERGRALALQGDNTGADQSLAEALAQAESLGQSTLIARVWEHMGLKHMRLRRFDDARVAYERAHALFVAGSDEDGQARMLGEMGLYHQRTGTFDEAARCFDRAIALHQARGNIRAAGHLYGRRGLFCLEQRRMAEARADLERSIAVAEQWGDASREATDYCNLGCLELDLGNHQAARHCLERALRLDSRSGNRPSEVIVIINLAVTDIDSGELDKAESHLGAALRLARETQYAHWEFLAMGNLGIVAQARGDLHGALAILEHVRAMSPTEELTWPAPSVFLAHLGSVQAALGDLEGARATFAQCRDRITRGKHPHYTPVVECLEAFCELTEASRATSAEQAKALRRLAELRLGVNAAQSADLRIAQRILRAAVAAQGAGGGAA